MECVGTNLFAYSVGHAHIWAGQRPIKLFAEVSHSGCSRRFESRNMPPLGRFGILRGPLRPINRLCRSERSLSGPKLYFQHYSTYLTFSTAFLATLVALQGQICSQMHSNCIFWSWNRYIFTHFMSSWWIPTWEDLWPHPSRMTYGIIQCYHTSRHQQVHSCYIWTTVIFVSCFRHLAHTMTQKW